MGGILGDIFYCFKLLFRLFEAVSAIFFWLDFGPRLTPGSHPRWINPSLFFCFFFETFPKIINVPINYEDVLNTIELLPRTPKEAELYYQLHGDLETYKERCKQSGPQGYEIIFPNKN